MTSSVEPNYFSQTIATTTNKYFLLDILQTQVLYLITFNYKILLILCLKEYDDNNSL